MNSSDVPRTDDELAEDITAGTDPSWLPDASATVPVEADAADWLDQERALPEDPSEEASGA